MQCKNKLFNFMKRDLSVKNSASTKKGQKFRPPQILSFYRLIFKLVNDSKT